MILPKMGRYIETFKVKDNNSKFMFSPLDSEKILEKYKNIWTKIEDLKRIKLNALPVYYDWWSIYKN